MPYRDRAHPLKTHGKGRFAGVGIEAYVQPRIVVSGTAIAGGVTEAQIVAGGETIILTISNGKWVPSGATFNAARQAIIDGLDSAQAEAAGWDVEVRDKEVVGAVVRTSDTVVTITLTAQAAYSVTADETITPTVPAAAMEGQFVTVVAASFVVTAA